MKKNLGQYFTPNYVADFMVSMAQINKNGEVLEPACGEGVFLKSLFKFGYKNVIGYEIDSTLECDSEFEIAYKSFVSEDFDKNFDLIIGNPPYIRWKNLESVLKDELSKNQLWNKYFNSLCDYLYIFILKSVELLNDNGELIFITPEYWINTKHSESLRNHMIRHGYFTDIYHFNETPIFENVTSSVMIFRYIKSQNKQNKKIEIKKYYDKRRLNATILEDIKSGKHLNCEYFSISQFELYDRWLIAPENKIVELKKFESSCSTDNKVNLFKSKNYLTINDIAIIGNGMVSGLDKAFQIPLNLCLNDNERKNVINVIKAKDLKSYTHGSISKYIFLNNIDISEEDFIDKYGNFYQHLMKYNKKLKERYDYNRELKNWEWAFLRNFKLFSSNQDRIFVPCKERITNRSNFRFAFVKSGIFPTQDVTAIFLKEQTRESIFYLLAFLNSKHVFNWLKFHGVVKGDIVEFSQKPIASIPFRGINWKDPNEIEIHNKISSYCEDYIKNPEESILVNINAYLDMLFD